MTDDSLVDTHYRLHEHVRYLHAYWYAYRQLFRAPVEDQRLLNAVAPGFFVLVMKAFIRTIFLEFRLLTENPVTMGRRNASLRGLLAAIDGDDWHDTHVS